jgi:hypothetical protein
MAYRSRAALYEGKQQSAREIADLTHMIESYWRTPELVDALDQTLGAAAVKGLLGSTYKLRAACDRLRQPDKAIEDLSFAIEPPTVPAPSVSRSSDGASARSAISKRRCGSIRRWRGEGGPRSHGSEAAQIPSAHP